MRAIAELGKRHQIVILFETQLNLALADALYVPGCDVVGDPAICEFVRNVILGRCLMAHHLSKTSELLTYATADFFYPPSFEGVLGEEVIRCGVCRYPVVPLSKIVVRSCACPRLKRTKLEPKCEALEAFNDSSEQNEDSEVPADVQMYSDEDFYDAPAGDSDVSV